MNPWTKRECRWCHEEAKHYLGGGIWVCFYHWLKTVLVV
jgi:hypothetical protein